jgi:thioredoxin-like negative regulator of GroEL
MDDWTSSLPPLEAAGWEQVLASHQVAVVHFWAPWSVVDRPMDKAIQETRLEFETVAFFSFDTTPEEHWTILQHFNICTLPHLICFFNGQEHARSVGYINAEQLRAKLHEWLAAST